MERVLCKKTRSVYLSKNKLATWHSCVVDRMCSVSDRYLPSQESPCDVTPDKLSLQTLQKVGRAWEQAYQLCIPEKCSTLNCAV